MEKENCLCGKRIELKSSCCDADVSVGGDKEQFENTCFYVCGKCKKPCDAKSYKMNRAGEGRVMAINLDYLDTDCDCIVCKPKKSIRLGCAHGRPSGAMCPHCLGINDYSKMPEVVITSTADVDLGERSDYWDTMTDILDGQFPKGKCKERGRALVMIAYIEMLLNGVKFDDNGQPIE